MSQAHQIESAILAKSETQHVFIPNRTSNDSSILNSVGQATEPIQPCKSTGFYSCVFQVKCAVTLDNQRSHNGPSKPAPRYSLPIAEYNYCGSLSEGLVANQPRRVQPLTMIRSRDITSFFFIGPHDVRTVL